MVITKLQRYFYSNLQGYIATKILLGWYKATIVIMDYKKASSSSSLIDGSSEPSLVHTLVITRTVILRSTRIPTW